MTVEVTFRGPLFNGSAAGILRQGVDQAALKVGEEAKEEVEAETKVFRNPTGRYRSLIRIERTAGFVKVVPGRLPYVRWLEGTSRRNQTTRFKGYHVFRNARDVVVSGQTSITTSHSSFSRDS